MNKKLLLLSSGALVALLVAGLIGVTIVSAQEPTPEPQEPVGRRPARRGPGGFEGGMFGLGHGDQWTAFDAMAEALGLTPVELFTELHAGQSLEQVAEAQGVDIELVRDAADAARSEARRQAIEQAAEDGRLTQEQADQMLERLEQGFPPDAGPMGRPGGPGSERNGDGPACPEDE